MSHLCLERRIIYQWNDHGLLCVVSSCVILEKESTKSLIHLKKKCIIALKLDKKETASLDR